MSSVKSKSTEELLKQKQGLEDFAAAAMSEGVAVDDQILAQIVELGQELERRGSAGLTIDSYTRWLGVSFDGYVTDSLVHESHYAYVFSAASDKGVRNIVRLAKSEISSDFQKSALHAYTEVYELTDGKARPLRVPPRLVLEQQTKRLAGMKAEMPSALEQSGTEGQQPYYRMQALEGQTLRELIDLGSIPLDVYLVEIFQQLALLLSRTGVHGNLKPEHVVCTRNGVHLLSPGYYGPLAVGGQKHSVAITTPAYYPFLEPDDLAAVGIMLWECVCKTHPLIHPGDTHLEDRLHPPFKQTLKKQISSGYPWLSSVLRLKTPSEFKPHLSSAAEQLLIKGLRLQFLPNGQLSTGSGFASWEEFSRALDGLAL